MTQLYRGMTRAAVDVAYNNVKAVVTFPQLLADFRTRSANLYETTRCRRNLEYGGGAGQRFDVLYSEKHDSRTVVYIHGGYWQTLSKEDFAFVAAGPLSRGFDVVLAEHTLAPHATMTQIVREIGMLLDHLSSNRDRLDLGRGPVCLAGHSAGGHLSLVHRSHPLVARTLAISPLVDLEPIGFSWLNDKLNLTPEEIATYSPIRHIGKGGPITVAVGGGELPELLRHANDYARSAEAAGEAVQSLTIDEANHFSILEQLAASDGALTRSITFDPS